MLGDVWGETLGAPVGESMGALAGAHVGTVGRTRGGGGSMAGDRLMATGAAGGGIDANACQVAGSQLYLLSSKQLYLANQCESAHFLVSEAGKSEHLLKLSLDVRAAHIPHAHVYSIITP